jgi:hypothetical protein
MSSAVRRKQESMATLNAARLARYQKIQAEIEEEGKRRIEQSKARAEKRFNYLYDTVFHGMLDPAGVIPQVGSSSLQPRKVCHTPQAYKLSTLNATCPVSQLSDDFENAWRRWTPR